ncbi:MAG: N-acetylglucosamine-6-phosphate deacetylase [Pseudomonadota bacterium]
MTQRAITDAVLLTPEKVFTGHALVLDGSRIHDIVPEEKLSAQIPKLPLPGTTIAPGFIDLQVNGGGGVLFNDNPSPETIAQIGAVHRKFGTTAFLPTLISDTLAKVDAALSAVARGQAAGIPGLIGLHLEGPFLAPGKKGIHDADHFTSLSDDTQAKLITHNVERLLLTLAPETVDTETISALAKSGIRVAAGHTEATYAQTKAALAAGLSGFTHLFNAMPPMLSRAPGPIPAALESDAWCSIIADGHHVADPMLRLVLRAKSDGRIVLVSDAMSTVGSEQTEFNLGGKTIWVEGTRLVDAEGTLAGAHLTMLGAVRHCVETLDVPIDQAVRMATAEPADFLQIADQRGRLSPGLAADLVVLSDTLAVIGTIVGGNVPSHLNKFGVKS